MKKGFFLLIVLFLLNGCAESIALLGSASNGRILQSSLNSAISYGVKHQTGKTPFGHVIAFAEEKNPEKKKETCISFIESTRSEFCTIAKKQITLTSTAVKEKALEIAKKYPKKNAIQNEVLSSEQNLITSLLQTKKSPRELAINFQKKIKKKETTKFKQFNQYSLRR